MKSGCIDWNKIILLIMAVALLVGVGVSGQYGTYYDQYIEEGICMMNISEYANRLLGTDWPTISESVEKDHGVALYYPLGALCMIIGQNEITSLLWHCYTFLLFFGGCLALFGIVYELFADKRLALVAFGLLYLSPRFFAEGHYNNKDVVLVALGLVVIYCGICYMRSMKLCHGICFALAGAVMSNVKIIGLWFFGVMGLGYVIKSLWEKKLDGRKLLEGLGVILAFFVVYFAITPAAWEDGIGFLLYCISNASSFSRWSGTVVYAGRHLEVPLPADYLPLQILYTTPPVLLLLCLVGHIRAFAAIVRREEGAFVYGLLLVLCLVPFVYAVCNRNLIVYNGWRHFYFIYGPLVIFMAVGIKAVVDLLRNRKLAWCVPGGVLIYLLFLVVLGHPYQFSYINSLADRPAQEDWQLDYWCVAGYSALDKLFECEERQQDYELSVTGEGTVKMDVERFGGKWGYRMRYVEAGEAECANYVIRNLTYDDAPGEGYHLLFGIEAYGNVLYEVYERDVW